MSETLPTISKWLKKQHVVSWCVVSDGLPWCANAFYYYDAERVAFFILTADDTRHATIAGSQAPVAGTVSGQPKTVALIRGVQFQGEINKLSDAAAEQPLQHFIKRFPMARMMAKSVPMWEIRIDELKFTDNTLGFGTKLHWLRGAE